MIVPVSVNAVSSNDSATESSDDAEPPEPDPSTAPVASAIVADMGATFRVAGYATGLTWFGLMVVIAAGFVPTAFMILRSSHRGRDGPIGRPS